MNSIRRQLLLWLLSAVLLGSLLAAAGMYVTARTEANRLFDYHLKQIALSLRDQAFGEDVIGTLEEEADYDFVIQVWREDGEQVYASHPHKGLPPRAQLGYDTVSTAEGAWRTFSLPEQQVAIQVAQPLEVRAELAAKLALRTLLPLLLLLPVLAALILAIVGRGLRPLDRLAQALRERSASALEALPETGLPRELKPLVRALNDLLRRLAHAIKAQRDFMSDAAHELRTPLTALQLQAQLAQRAASAAEREAAFAGLREGLKRAVHSVQQLLTLARHESGVVERAPASVDLSELAKAVVAEHALLAEAKQIDLGMARDAPAPVEGDPDALRVLLANLIDNAIRYTPNGGRIDVSVGVEDGEAGIEVSDSGPGIPAQDRERVFDRFYRREGSATSGSGLGLAIVKNIADQHGARIALAESAPGGLSVRVSFPRAARRKISEEVESIAA